MKPLTLSTCMAPNMDFLCQDLAGYLAERLRLPVRARIDIPWQERERLLEAGEVDLCWICGLPYVRKADRTPGLVEPLVAPVMAGERYFGKPVYFSDVVVGRKSSFQRLEELRGCSWAYNEPGSHSGYGVVRYELAKRGESLSFFGRVIESGAHQTSLGMILRGEVDASAIDSTVLEMELANHPEIAPQIRIIDSFGPSPIPPWVVSRGVTEEVRARLSDTLTRIGEDEEGRDILARARMRGFVRVSDKDYDPIRRMMEVGGVGKGD